MTSSTGQLGLSPSGNAGETGRDGGAVVNPAAVAPLDSREPRRLQLAAATDVLGKQEQPDRYGGRVNLRAASRLGSDSPNEARMAPSPTGPCPLIFPAVGGCRTAVAPIEYGLCDRGSRGSPPGPRLHSSIKPTSRTAAHRAENHAERAASNHHPSLVDEANDAPSERAT